MSPNKADKAVLLPYSYFSLWLVKIHECCAVDNIVHKETSNCCKGIKLNRSMALTPALCIFITADM